MLRLLRFAARFDFQLHSTVLDAAEDLQVHEARNELAWVVPWCDVGMLWNVTNFWKVVFG